MKKGDKVFCVDAGEGTIIAVHFNNGVTWFDVRFKTGVAVRFPSNVASH